MARSKKTSKDSSSSSKPATRSVRTRGGPKRGEVFDPDAQLEVPGAERPRIKAIDRIAMTIVGIQADRNEALTSFDDREAKENDKLMDLMVEHGLDTYAIDGDWVVKVEDRGKQVKVKRAAKAKKGGSKGPTDEAAA